MFKEYLEYDALGLAELVKSGEVSATALLDAAISQAQSQNPKLNAIVHQFEARAHEAIDAGLPEGPFAGVPFLLKDLTAAFAGEPMTMGSRGVRWVPDYHSEHVTRQIASGVNVFGKTNTPELGLTITTEPLAHGPTHNPHKQGYSTGGSSGGSACSVAAGIVPMAGAGDGGGSIRFPSAWCGVFGLKPSRGLVPLGPDSGEAWSGAVAEHVITRSVRDSAAMLDCTAGSEIGAPYKVDKHPEGYLSAALQSPKPLRIALSRKPLIEGTEVDAEVQAALEQTAETLRQLGHRVEEVEPAIDTRRFWLDFFTVVCSHTAAVEREIKRNFGAAAAAQLEWPTKNMAQLGRSIRADEFVDCLHGWHLAQAAMGELHKTYDMMLCPTVPTTAIAHGVLPPSAHEQRLMQMSGALSFLGTGRIALKTGMVEQLSKPILSKMAFTILGNMTGLPAMSVPLHMSSDGLPIGMQFVGRMCDERTLFSLAGQLEREGLFTKPAFA